MIDLNELIAPVNKILDDVGQFQMAHFRKDNVVIEKDKKELVSKIDIESEKKIKEALLTLLPQAEFYGEESGTTSKHPENQLLWVVDPIDGTTNYLSGIDQFSISIALLDKSDPIFGSVYNPATKEIFQAIKDKGMFHNHQLVPKAEHTTIQNSLIGTGFPYRNPETYQDFSTCAEKVLINSRGIRRFGSAALDLSYVACNYLQGFWEVGLQPYDIAAALVFLNETNCQYSNFSGEKYNIFKDNTLVAGIPGTFESLQKITSESYQ